tara:strand:+ start:7706 stop:8059 length:354 start_codon:yes stop_codon:yes gene_type:complete
MEKFQQITMTVAIVILIFCLAAIGVIMYYSTNEDVFPPVEAACPAFFEQRKEDNKVFCELPDVVPGYSGEKRCVDPFELRNNTKADKCANRQLAIKCNWSWDGITNLRNPCDDINLD